MKKLLVVLLMLLICRSSTADTTKVVSHAERTVQEKSQKTVCVQVTKKQHDELITTGISVINVVPLEGEYSKGLIYFTKRKQVTQYRSKEGVIFIETIVSFGNKYLSLWTILMICSFVFFNFWIMYLHKKVQVQNDFACVGPFVCLCVMGVACIVCLIEVMPFTGSSTILATAFAYFTYDIVAVYDNMKKGRIDKAKLDSKNRSKWACIIGYYLSVIAFSISVYYQI